MDETEAGCPTFCLLSPFRLFSVALPSYPQLAVERTVLDGFGNVLGVDGFGAG